jgi:hypothetical protein
MKVSLCHFAQTHTVERDSDDLPIDEVLGMVEDLLIGAGYCLERGSLSVTDSGGRKIDSRCLEEF